MTIAIVDAATLAQRIAELQGGGGGGGAPTTASYVTLSTDATLTAERVLTTGHGIDITDGGAGTTVTIAVDETELDAPIPALVDGTWTGATSITTLGTIATGVWQGTAVAVANGGTGSTTAAGARSNLGLAIGTNVQAWDADLDALAAGTWVGATSVTTLGTITTGTWQGSVIGAAYLGTGTPTGAVLVGGAWVAGSSSGHVLRWSGSAWASAALSASDISTGAVSVAARLGWLTTSSTASTTDSTNGTTTNTPSWSVTTGKTYLIEVIGTYDAAASTNGFRCRMEESGGASSSVCAGQVWYSHASGIAAEPITAAGTWTAAGTSSTSRAGIELRVTYVCTGTGTLRMAIRPETGGSNINLYSSTMYRILEL